VAIDQAIIKIKINGITNKILSFTCLSPQLSCYPANKIITANITAQPGCPKNISNKTPTQAILGTYLHTSDLSHVLPTQCKALA
jgi:hypothetical protein